ncbi:hypothetical protein chiPu_0004792 [Chiloscyllium punctatum]|uniref:Uncharacterized protein n=1 Tax=Chiloscyllium punctatum TaxID=137246 RepID=A0A401S7K9_CHIPU|nr:hypothetical protein [Chiloscyllium punctatum]
MTVPAPQWRSRAPFLCASLRRQLRAEAPGLQLRAGAPGSIVFARSTLGLPGCSSALGLSRPVNEWLLSEWFPRRNRRQCRVSDTLLEEKVNQKNNALKVT